MRYSGTGGQAVIEGTVVKNKDNYVTAARKPDGEIEIQKDRYVSMMERVKFFSLPFTGGIFSFADSLILGVKTLAFSASLFKDDKDDLEPLKFELFLNRMFGKRLEKILTGVVMMFSVVLAVGIFMVLSLFISSIFRRFVTSGTLVMFLEGAIRTAISAVYIKLISRMEDVRWALMHHGVGHRCINCIEHGFDLTVDNVRASSRQYKRCETSFLIIMMVISTLFLMVIQMDNFRLKALNRTVLIPVIVSVSYEFLRLVGGSGTWLVSILSKSGMWMQNPITKEPDDSMIEVVIETANTVFDWEEYLKESFPERESSSDSDITAAAGRRSWTAKTGRGTGGQAGCQISSDGGIWAQRIGLSA